MQLSGFDKGRRLPPFFFLLAALVVPTALASDADWLECDAIDKNARRLECYDQVARSKGSMRDAKARKEADFGKSEAIEQDLVIESRIEKVSYTTGGKSVFQLANGQVWVENEAGRTRIRTGQNVTIKKALMSYSMKLQSGIIVAVSRIE